MNKDSNEFHSEFLKRPLGKPLSFNELEQLREIPYKLYKTEPVFLELLI
jgi:hypothetical protein